VFFLHSNARKPSVFWHCWFHGRNGIHPVKNWVVGCWCGYLGRGADLHGPADATATHYLLFQYIQIGFTFLVSSFWYRLTRVVPDKIQRALVVVVVVVVVVQENFVITSIQCFSLVRWQRFIQPWSSYNLRFSSGTSGGRNQTAKPSLPGSAGKMIKCRYLKILKKTVFLAEHHILVWLIVICYYLWNWNMWKFYVHTVVFLLLKWVLNSTSA